jgi:hypothetical protein
MVLDTEPRRVEQPPGRVVEVHLAGFADGSHLLADTEFVEHGERVSPEPQTRAGGADLRSLLVDHDLHPGAAQREATREPHDPATDHHGPRPNVHCVPPPSSCAATVGTADDLLQCNLGTE